jgi:non-lysosomal glucosylceramidase
MIATWPHGDRPEQPLLYCCETMPGFEYQVAFNLIYAGYVHEGLTLVKSIRDRFDGKKRNPFCEFEWGNHYARSMIAYTGMLALSRFRYSAVDRTLQFAPQLGESDFRQFFSVASGWGVISQSISSRSHTVTVSIAKGELEIGEFRIRTADRVAAATARCAQTQVSTRQSAGQGVHPEALNSFILEKPLTARVGEPVALEVRL